MGILQKKCRTTGKKALAYRGKGGQNTGTAFPALRLGVVLYLLIVGAGGLIIFSGPKFPPSNSSKLQLQLQHPNLSNNGMTSQCLVKYSG